MNPTATQESPKTTDAIDEESTQETDATSEPRLQVCMDGQLDVEPHPEFEGRFITEFGTLYSNPGETPPELRRLQQIAGRCCKVLAEFADIDGTDDPDIGDEDELWQAVNAAGGLGGSMPFPNHWFDPLSEHVTRDQLEAFALLLGEIRSIVLLINSGDYGPNHGVVAAFGEEIADPARRAMVWVGRMLREPGDVIRIQ